LDKRRFDSEGQKSLLAKYIDANDSFQATWFQKQEKLNEILWNDWRKYKIYCNGIIRLKNG